MMRFRLRRAVQLIFVFIFFVLFNFFYQAFVVIESNSDGVFMGHQGQNGVPSDNFYVDTDGKRVDSNKRRITALTGKGNSVPKHGKEHYHREKRNAKQIEDSSENFENPEQRRTELSDIFISVKTTKAYHSKRLDLILDTWHVLARDETYFFTDENEEEYRKKTRGHLINTNCSAVHSRKALCCKMSVEFDTYIASKKRWFCHVDDDTYVNIPSLLRLVQSRNHTDDWYLGKPSLSHSLEIADSENKGQKVSFWFATGGAGFCISRGLALKMVPYAGGGKLKTACGKIRLPDDCTIGFIIYHYLKKELTVIKEFHSHLEGLWRINQKSLSDQITMSYKYHTNNGEMNVVLVNGFSQEDDPTRFRSIHCHLYPYLKGCPQT